MREQVGPDASRLRAAGIDPAAVSAAARALAGALIAGGQVLVCGNGGSAADAQHLAAELVGRFEAERAGWPALALTTDSSAMTAIANDFGFERVFARQVEALGRPGDVLLAISTSGRSPNVLAAVEAGRERGLVTIGLCGPQDSPLARRCHLSIRVPGSTAAEIQEGHLMAEHAICRELEGSLLAAERAGRDRPPGSVVELELLLELRERWRASGRTVVWTNGCFDLVHRGHLASLEAARALGDVLVVGINSDASVRRLKGEGRPLITAGERAELLAALRVVDYVVVFDEDTPAAVLSALEPEIHAKGADYAGPRGKAVPEREVVEAYGGRVEFLPLLPDRSSSGLISALGAQRTAADGVG
jgi:phosphoheptose isomerase